MFFNDVHIMVYVAFGILGLIVGNILPHINKRLIEHKRVFDKSFTGENGRIMAKSTGMGLYIVKKLCDKLGHKIIIESEIHKYTKITIIFYKNDFYKVD